jgi:hypothetical protein
MGEYVKLCGKVGPRDDSGNCTLCRDEDTHVGGHTYLSAAAIEQARIRALAAPADSARPPKHGPYGDGTDEDAEAVLTKLFNEHKPRPARPEPCGVCGCPTRLHYWNGKCAACPACQGRRG